MVSSSERQRLGTGEAARYAGLGKSTLDKYRLTGGGPRYSKIGRRVVYDTAEIDSWLDKHQRQSTSQTEVDA